MRTRAARRSRAAYLGRAYERCVDARRAVCKLRTARRPVPRRSDGAGASRSRRMRAHGRNSSALTRVPVYFDVHPRHVYVHVPFCARRCAYCDFSIAVRRNVPSNEYVDAIERELEIRYPDRGEWVADTLYL